jgi:V/A-type H+-transporting ATPase subunit I
MIVKMKQVTVLTDAKYRQATLEQLRELGVLHPQIVERSSSEEIQQTESELERLDKALAFLEEEETSQAPPEGKEAKAIIDAILGLSDEKDKLSQALYKLVETRHWFETWGNVSYESIQTLKKAGIYCRFYNANKKDFEEFETDKMIQVIVSDQNIVRLVLISQSPDDQLDFKEDPMPEIELDDLTSEIDHIEGEIKRINGSIAEMQSARPLLLDQRAKLQKELEFNTVAASMEGSERIIYLQGFCPQDSIKDIEKMAEEQGVGLIIEDPDNAEAVPTLLRQPKWLRIIQPLFDFMGTLPGYKEQDISFIFLVFFSIFYAMLVGDAGYGLVMLAGTWYLARKNKKAPREVFRLMYLLSFTTILWGLFSGTWFGSEAMSKLPVLREFIIKDIYSFSDVNQAVLMQLTFIIGAVHLSLGHLIAAIKKINSLTAVAELGWIVVLAGIYFVANSLVLGKAMPGITAPLILSGAGLILLFANFQKNIIKGVLVTLGNLPLDIINSFSDVVSYIRLFAVGMATVIVAASFNEMAVGSGIDSVIGGILAVIVLVFGHALNITLALMAVLVHGVRLNMLEFSSHVDMQWSGKKYNPFRK